MSHRRSWKLSAFACLSSLLGAQKDVEIYIIPADKIERATRQDDQGLVQWAEHKVDCPTCKGKKTTTCAHCVRLEDHKKCPECQMKKEAPCRTCGGLGSWPDPLEKVQCPGCAGAGCIVCFVCGGRGGQKVEGSGDRLMDCVACRGEGGFKCGTGSGSRLVETMALKPSLKDANAALLQKAKDQVDAVLKSLNTLHPTGKNTRKDVKDFGKLLQPLAGVMPPMKRLPKTFEDMMGKVDAGSVYMGHEEREVAAIQFTKANTEYYLKHQQRMLALCLLRAEANAKVLAEKGAKK